MKKTLILAAIASLMLTVSCGENTTSTTATAPAASTDKVENASSSNIAFIRMDSLMNAYGMFMDLSDEFSKKQTAAQKQLAAKGRSLEKEVAEYQEKIQKGTVTRYQASSIEEGLQKKQQDLAAYQEKMGAELGEAQAVMSAKVSKVILDYLEEFNADKKYSMILQTMGGSPVIIADPSLDITNEVLSVLNSRYEDSLAQKNK